MLKLFHNANLLFHLILQKRIAVVDLLDGNDIVVRAHSLQDGAKTALAYLLQYLVL